MVITGACLIVITGCFTGKLPAQGTVIDIKDVRNSPKPQADLPNHKNHDVEVYRVIQPGNAYQVSFYRKENDTLRCYHLFWGEKKKLDKAAYEWVNDSTASIHFYSSRSRKNVAFKVSGSWNANNKSTSLITDN